MDNLFGVRCLVPLSASLCLSVFLLPSFLFRFRLPFHWCVLRLFFPLIKYIFLLFAFLLGRMFCTPHHSRSSSHLFLYWKLLRLIRGSPAHTHIHWVAIGQCSDLQHGHWAQHHRITALMPRCSRCSNLDARALWPLCTQWKNHFYSSIASVCVVWARARCIANGTRCDRSLRTTFTT